MRWAFIFARAKAGNNMAAKMAMMAITTNNSMRVNPNDSRRCQRILESELGLFI